MTIQNWPSKKWRTKNKQTRLGVKYGILFVSFLWHSMAFFGGIPPDNYMYKYCIRFWLRPQFWSPTSQATKTHLGEAQAARSPSWARAIVWRIQWFCLMAVKRCATATRDGKKMGCSCCKPSKKKTPCHKLYQFLSFTNWIFPKLIQIVRQCRNTAVSQPWGTTHDWFPNKTWPMLDDSLGSLILGTSNKNRWYNVGPPR